MVVKPRNLYFMAVKLVKSVEIDKQAKALVNNTVNLLTFTKFLTGFLPIINNFYRYFY